MPRPFIPRQASPLSLRPRGHNFALPPLKFELTNNRLLTVRHLTRLQGGLRALHSADEAAVVWLDKTSKR